MASSSNFRSWMDESMKDSETGLLKDDYARGIMEFMAFAGNQSTAQSRGKMKCPCSKCLNMRNVKIELIWNHLYKKGFMRGYKIWYLHGETETELGSSSEANVGGNNMDEIREVDFGIGTVRMVNDAFTDTTSLEELQRDMVDEPNAEARRFFDMLDGAKQPLYKGCRDGHSPLSSASRMMSIKTDFNLSEECVDAFAEFVKDLLPEDNMSPASYYEIQKLVAGIGLPYRMIDVCIDNCMIFWREDEDLRSCKWCRKPRFQEGSGRVPVPYKKMWYLPLTERLKRLYQSERTAAAMRWHAEHRQDGEITHPSDAEAWKHFQSIYPDFAFERRNVYLGLCTDGFNPFGRHGRQYSLWPVIVTPYNLPPSMCMRREFLFLSILVPGPEHPKRSLDVFLQPLIHELQMLWDHGTEAYDVSLQQNFNMHVVLMWTISDFPAYGMLSGWTTHGRLSCPYCQDNTDAFQLRHGRKCCWFDCHRRFLPERHPYRRSRTFFTANKRVVAGSPPELDGRSILDQLRDFGAQRTTECGGNGHVPVDGVGVNHNWHKKSIFWELPYWKDHLLRHNLDVMHIEKNVFDNIMNTVLNVQGKTKDNMKSRLDLAMICSRDDLRVLPNGKCPMPAYRLSANKITAFFDWIRDEVKFPDGYAANLRNCVNYVERKFTGMKSHDCHVVMQRLLPFAFSQLLDNNVHEAIAGTGAFFRDLCSRTLTTEGIRNLENNIPKVICNLEKIFPPSFFDVMEHLPIHLPHEALLGGPVQYRWMYPFERYMFHLKKKVKNLSKVEGSIIAQSLNEEASHFAEYYFPSQVRTKSRRPPRHDDRGERALYQMYVPELFSQVGRVSGKGMSRQLTEQELNHLHMYILENCDDIQQYESMYMSYARTYYHDCAEEELESIKHNEFADWLKFYVNEGIGMGQTFDAWLVDLINGPNYITTSYPRYCTRGYAFRIRNHGRRTVTSDFGVSAKSADLVYYGVLNEILEVRYPGFLNLRCIIFKCDWYNPTLGYGYKVDQFGVTSVHAGRKLITLKYDPFILASQADQVCYIPYPRVSNRNDHWLTVTSITPRGKIYGVGEHDPLQPAGNVVMGDVETSEAVELIGDFTSTEDAAVHSDYEDTPGEFDDDNDSLDSNGTSSESD